MGCKGGGEEWAESEGMKSSLAYQAKGIDSFGGGGCVSVVCEDMSCDLHVILSGNVPEDVAILLLPRPSSCLKSSLLIVQPMLLFAARLGGAR